MAITRLIFILISANSFYCCMAQDSKEYYMTIIIDGHVIGTHLTNFHLLSDDGRKVIPLSFGRPSLCFQASSIDSLANGDSFYLAFRNSIYSDEDIIQQDYSIRIPSQALQESIWIIEVHTKQGSKSEYDFGDSEYVYDLQFGSQAIITPRKG